MLLLLLPIWQQKGGDSLTVIISFIISIEASIAAYYICKWLDGD